MLGEALGGKLAVLMLERQRPGSLVVDVTGCGCSCDIVVTTLQPCSGRRQVRRSEMQFGGGAGDLISVVCRPQEVLLSLSRQRSRRLH